MLQHIHKAFVRCFETQIFKRSSLITVFTHFLFYAYCHDCFNIV